MNTTRKLNSSRSSGIGRKIAISSISLLVMTHNAIAAIMNEMKVAFPSVDPTTVQSFLTIATFTIMIGTLTSGIIAGFIGKRRILLIGLVIFTVGGVAPFFLSGFSLMMASRVVMGLGSGLINPIAASLIADFYEGDERAQLMGFKATAGSLGQTITTLLAGVLATFGWRYSFWIYLIGALVFVICFITIPEPPKITNESGGTVKAKDSYKVTPGVIAVTLVILMYMMLYLSILSNFAIVIAESELGNAATAGSIISGMTLASMITALLFGEAFKRLKNYVPVIGLIFYSVGMVILSLSYSLPVITVVMVLFGIGNGCIVPFCYTLLAKYSPKTSMTFCMSIMIVGVNIGSFISPYVMTGLATMMGNNSGRFKFQIAAVCFFGLLVLAVIYAVRAGKPERNTAS